MIDPAIYARILKASETCRWLNLTQSQIAEALGASQGQVSRILSGRVQRTSRLLEEVCLYIERMDQGVTAEAVRANDDLINALCDTWNGSAGHAKALATVIRATKALAPVKEPPSC